MRMQNSVGLSLWVVEGLGAVQEEVTLLLAGFLRMGKVLTVGN